MKEYLLNWLGVLVLVVMLSIMVGCGRKQQDNRVEITTENEAQTATAICQQAGFSTAVSGKKCDGEIYIFPDSFEHSNCKPGATKYQDCFDFYPCSILEQNLEQWPGVIFEVIYCE